MEIELLEPCEALSVLVTERELRPHDHEGGVVLDGPTRELAGFPKGSHTTSGFAYHQV